MARKRKEGATPRTYRLNDEVIERIERIAEKEKRTVTAQIEVFLGDKAKEYEAREKGQPQTA